MTRRRLFWLLFLTALALGFGLPILAMVSCDGWNEGSMAVATCTPDLAAVRVTADYAYGIVLLASFTLGVPLLLWGALLWLGAWLVARLLAGAFALPH